MALLSWNNSLKVNIGQIDNQHQRLVELVNQLHSGMVQGQGTAALSKVLDGLIEYTKTHFATEEKLMDTHQYPQAMAHKAEHKNLVQQVSAIQTKYKQNATGLSVEVMNFLRDWLTKHILQVDKKLGVFLAEKGIS